MIFVKDMPRTIDTKTAIRAVNICRDNGIKSVGVFLNQSKDEISNILHEVDLDVIQLHGNENIDDYTVINKDIINTIHVSDNTHSQLSKLNLDQHTYLLDATSAQMHGGTGNTFDWNVLKDLMCDKLIIAGGLKPDNILDLLGKYTPKCVDVSSGIERKVGYKDHKLMSDFVEIIRTYYEK
jgi:phosphoribosylanthranilate isomerase